MERWVGSVLVLRRKLQSIAVSNREEDEEGIGFPLQNDYRALVIYMQNDFPALTFLTVLDILNP